jgi:alanyl-tRNA synthetase
LKKRARRLEERLAAFESREIIRAAEGRVIAGVLEDKTPEEARFLALAIVKGGEYAVAYGAVGERQAHVILARSEALKADLRQAVPAVAAIVPVKGGGGPSLVELVMADQARLADAVAAAATWLRENA